MTYYDSISCKDEKVEERDLPFHWYIDDILNAYRFGRYYEIPELKKRFLKWVKQEYKE